jgi:hypothetical protein
MYHAILERTMMHDCKMAGPIGPAISSLSAGELEVRIHVDFGSYLSVHKPQSRSISEYYEFD